MITTLMLVMLLGDQYHAYEVDSWRGEGAYEQCVEAAKVVAVGRAEHDELYCEVRWLDGE